MRAFSRQPVMGYGTNGFNWAVHSQPHNAYLAVLVENGFVGFVLYMSMFFAVFIKLLNLPPLERRFTLVLLATLAVAMLPLGWENRKPVWFILGTLAALSQAQFGGIAGAWQQAARRGTPLGPGPRRARMPLSVPVQNADSGHRP